MNTESRKTSGNLLVRITFKIKKYTVYLVEKQANRKMLTIV